eukprot:Lithocolla_globosa_v1_NODE_957_length_3033_cov_50.121894.p1 type:complete len:539 gc:universal NODE_957_length_3033_cov_50.121894:2-1618(+)
MGGFLGDHVNKTTMAAKDRIQTLQRHFDQDGKIVTEDCASEEKSELVLKSKEGAEIKIVPEGENAGSFVILRTKPNSQTLSVVDNRTGRTYEIPIENGAVDAKLVQKITTGKDDTGLRIFDPGYTNTAVTKSKICFIDGDRGILQYRGYPIEELAEKSSYLEVSYLLIYGNLPAKSELAEWTHQITRHTFLHTNLMQLMKSFNYDAHPMGMFVSVMSAMSTFHPDANPSLTKSDVYVNNSILRNIQIYRILGKASTVAACAYRHRIGRPYNFPQHYLTYTDNFLYMMDHLDENSYLPNPVLSKALDVMFILHADHELNCSTAAMRHIGSSQVDPYSAIAGAAAALYGPLHGGACEAVLRMLEEIGSVENVPAFLEGVKKRQRKLMGFGHRVYKNYDPRARIIKSTAYKVFEVCGKEKLIDVAIVLEQTALTDPFFVERKLYPNVDFYSGLIYKSMGFPTDFFPVLFAIPRVAGWLAHWKEQVEDPSTKIWRPRQVYLGEGKRSYVPMEYRKEVDESHLHPHVSAMSKRTTFASFTRPS